MKIIHEINRRINDWLIQSIIGRLILRFLYSILKKNKVSWKKIVGIKQFAEINNIQTMDFCEKRSIKILQDKLGDATKNGKREEISLFPLSLAEIPNAIIFGECEGVLSEDYVINDRILTEPEVVWSPRPWYVYLSNNKEGCALVNQCNNVTNEYENGLDLRGRYSDNWWHFTFELLTKLYYYDQNEKYKNYRIIVDKCVLEDRSSRLLLEVTNVFKRELIVIEKDSPVRVKNLAVMSSPVFESRSLPQMHSWWKQGVSQMYIMYYYDALEYIRKNVLSRYGKPFEQGKRVFIARAKKGRLDNESVVAEQLRTKGFEIIYSDQFTFEREVDIFSSSEIIVSTLGAAMTNLLYCNSNAKVICIFPEEVSSVITGYSDIADLVGFTFYLADASISKQHSSSNGIEYIVEEKQMEKMLKALDELR